MADQFLVRAGLKLVDGLCEKRVEVSELNISIKELAY